MADQLAGGRATSRRHPPLWLDENRNSDAPVVGSPNGDAIEGSDVVRKGRLRAAGFPRGAERRNTLPPTGRSAATTQLGTRLPSAMRAGNVQRMAGASHRAAPAVKHKRRSRRSLGNGALDDSVDTEGGPPWRR